MLDSNYQQTKLKWIDEHTRGREQLGREGDPEQDLCMKTNILPINLHRKVLAKHLRSQMKVPLCQNQYAKLYPSMYHDKTALVAPPSEVVPIRKPQQQL